MTPREKKLLHFIEEHIHAQGFSPTYSEMAAAMGQVSKGPMHKAVESLIRQRKLQRGAALAKRSLLLTGALDNFSSADLRRELARRGEPGQ